MSTVAVKKTPTIELAEKLEQSSTFRRIADNAVAEDSDALFARRAETIASGREAERSISARVAEIDQRLAEAATIEGEARRVLQDAALRLRDVRAEHFRAAVNLAATVDRQRRRLSQDMPTELIDLREDMRDLLLDRSPKINKHARPKRGLFALLLNGRRDMIVETNVAAVGEQIEYLSAAIIECDRIAATFSGSHDELLTEISRIRSGVPDTDTWAEFAPRGRRTSR